MPTNHRSYNHHTIFQPPVHRINPPPKYPTTTTNLNHHPGTSTDHSHLTTPHHNHPQPPTSTELNHSHPTISNHSQPKPQIEPQQPPMMKANHKSNHSSQPPTMKANHKSNHSSQPPTMKANHKSNPQPPCPTMKLNPIEPSQPTRPPLETPQLNRITAREVVAVGGSIWLSAAEFCWLVARFGWRWLSFCSDCLFFGGGDGLMSGVVAVKGSGGVGGEGESGWWPDLVGGGSVSAAIAYFSVVEMA